MDAETPLPKIAGLLPRDGAALLASRPPEIQQAVMILVRATLLYWEGQRMTLDPIQYEVVMNGLIAQFIRQVATTHALAQYLRVAADSIDTFNREDQ